MTVSSLRRFAACPGVAVAALVFLGQAAAAQPVAPAAPDAATAPSVQNSTIDAPLFYQLLIGELELRDGRPGNAFQVILDAARRHNDDALFQRAVDIALQVAEAFARGKRSAP